MLVAVSLTLGVVHLVERFFAHDPAEPDELVYGVEATWTGACETRPGPGSGRIDPPC